MPTESPWYSTKPETKVYHNRTDCTEGNNIEPYNVERGTGGKRLCDHCQRLMQEETFFFNKTGMMGGLSKGLFGFSANRSQKPQ